MTGRPGKTFFADITPSTARDGLAAFRREWDSRIDQPWPLPGYSIGESGDLRVKVRAVKAHDVVLLDVCNYGGSFTGRTTGDRDNGDRVLAHLMRRGAWHFARPNGRGETVTGPAGSFIALNNGPPSLVEVDPGATAKVLTLPASVLAPLMGGRQIVGSAHSARSAEVRVLMAHANIVCETVHDLTPAGVRGVRDALLELVRGTLMREFDDVEPRLAPALARAAMEIADSHLADAELSPSSLARELNVSVRTLHRAFAAAGESAAAYVRRRRLDQARLELAAPSGRPGVSEVAARWHFVDSSHFTRAFKKQYGETPAQFARSSGTGGNAAHAGSEAVMVNPDRHDGF
jgi:AraC family transcriptional activator of tynA and feaB